MFTQGAKSTSGLFNNSFPIAKRSFEKREAHISKLFVVSTLGRKSVCILKPWLSAVLNRRSRPRSLCDRVHPAMGNTLYQTSNSNLVRPISRRSSCGIPLVHLHPSSLAPKYKGGGEEWPGGGRGEERRCGGVDCAGETGKGWGHSGLADQQLVSPAAGYNRAVT